MQRAGEADAAIYKMPDEAIGDRQRASRVERYMPRARRPLAIEGQAAQIDDVGGSRIDGDSIARNVVAPCWS